jgi:hypothetical protein
MHYFFDYQGIMIPERCIESIAQEVYSEHKNEIDDYISARLSSKSLQLKRAPLTLYVDSINLDYLSVPILFPYDDYDTEKKGHSA